MSASNFLACFNITESFEGSSYVDNPHDPGGATLKGVTQAVYTAWRASHGLPNAPVRDATDADIADIYRAQYWNPVRGDDLPTGLDLLVVDYGWGSGPVTAIQALQHVVGVTVDGHLGAITLDAVRGKTPVTLISALCDYRERFFKSLPTWRYFGVGWQRRLDGVKTRALEMARM